MFTTSENVDLSKGLVVLHGKALQPFSRDKLYLSVNDSLKNRKTATSDATSLTDTIISHLDAYALSGSIKNIDIAQTALLTLKRFDKAAATHYQAYHPHSEESVLR